MFRFGMGLICFLLLAGVTGPTVAKNCSSAEKRQANEVLERIENDQLLRDELIALHLPFGIHTSTSDTDGEDVLVQGGYIMAHDQDLRTSIWVTYRLTRKDIEGAVGKKRVNCFRKDPRFARGEGASTSDYREPTYDQGHLANDADLKDDFIQQLNSYVMSNMSPQECRFNRGIWLSLEHLTRIWARAYGEIFVISGAIFDRDKLSGRDPDEHAQRMRSNSGKMRVGVPSHFYKVIVREEGDGYRGISFLMKHTNDHSGSAWEEVKGKVMRSISSIAEIEARASIRLHPELNRTLLSEEPHDWDFSTGMANFEASCK